MILDSAINCLKKVAMATFFIVLSIPALLGQHQWQGRLWKISGNGLDQPSWLFGTFHSVNPKVFQFPDSLLPIMARVDIAGFELDMTQIDLISLTSALKADRPMDTYFRPATYRKLCKLFNARTGLFLEDFQTVKPLFVLIQLLDKPSPGDSAMALDMYLQSYARLHGRQVIGLETLSEQLSAMDVIPEKDQAEELKRTLLRPQNPNNGMDTLLSLYLSGNLDALYSMGMSSMVPGSAVDSAMLQIRNSQMSKRIITWIQNKSCLFCLGALHLPGSHGVIEQLRTMGYSVVPINTKD